MLSQAGFCLRTDQTDLKAIREFDIVEPAIKTVVTQSHGPLHKYQYYLYAWNLLKYCKNKLDIITSAMIGNVILVSYQTSEPHTVLILSPLCWFSLLPRVSPELHAMSGWCVWVGSDAAVLLQLSRNDCHCIHIRQGRE